MRRRASVSWYAEYWQEEPITLRAFRSLLSAYRFFSVGADETLEALLAESATDQQEVTDQLGYQVRRAVEVLIQAIDRVDQDRADQDRGRTLLAGLDEKELYEAALTVMMRLVFLFSAEERGLLLLGDPLYDQSYAVSTLSEQLRETADHGGRGGVGAPLRCVVPVAGDVPRGARWRAASRFEVAGVWGESVQSRSVSVP